VLLSWNADDDQMADDYDDLHDDPLLNAILALPYNVLALPSWAEWICSAERPVVEGAVDEPAFSALDDDLARVIGMSPAVHGARGASEQPSRRCRRTRHNWA
jgi:hypothetical protein